MKTNEKVTLKKDEIDFENKDEVAYWAFQLKITKTQLRRARRKTNSSSIAILKEYIDTKFKL